MGTPSYYANDDYRLAVSGSDNYVSGWTPEHWYSGMGDSLWKSIFGGTTAVTKAGWDAASSGRDWNEEPGVWGTLAGMASEGGDPNRFGATLEAVQDWAKPDPRNSSYVAQIAGSTVRGFTILGMGSLFGGPLAGPSTLGVTEGYSDYTDSLKAGLDPTTALEKAGLTGLTAFAGAYLPMKVSGRVAMNLAGLAAQAEIAGNETLASLLYGAARTSAFAATNTAARLGTAAAVNAGFGITNRYLTSHLLESAGYKDMAQQYVPLDGKAIAADTVLGLAFGGLGLAEDAFGKAPEKRPSLETVKDAFEVRREEMTARGAAGIPSDGVTADLDATLRSRAIESAVKGWSFKVTPEEAQQIIEGSLVDPQRVELNNRWHAAYERAYGSFADVSPAERIGWADLEGEVPVHLQERFAEDRRVSDRNVSKLEAEEKALLKRGQDVYNKAEQWVRDARGENFTEGDVVRVLRDQPMLQKELAQIRREMDVLADRRAEVEQARDASLDRWLGIHRGEEPPTPIQQVETKGTVESSSSKGQPEAPQTPAEAARELLDPMVKEHLDQVVKGFPDMEVALPDGTTLKASELRDYVTRELGQVEADTKLLDVGVACFLETML
jgi:hypothetical protein